jgi:hypothetical protein
MFHRAAASVAAILTAIGVALAVPVVSSSGGVPAAQAGADNGSIDDLTDENLPEDGDQPPAPAPTVTPPAPVVTELPPVPQDTLEDDGTDDESGDVSDEESGGSGEVSHDVSDESSNNSGGNIGSGHRSSGQSIASQRLSVAQSTVSAVSDTGAIPQGGVQAGGGGTAP